MAQMKPVFYINDNTILQEIYQRGTKKTYKEKTRLVQGGRLLSSLYFIDEGRARYIRSSPEEEERIISILQKGSFIGLVPFLVGQRPTCNMSIVSETDMVLYEIPNDVFESMLSKHSTLYADILKYLANCILLHLQEIEDLSFTTCEKRLCLFFHRHLSKIDNKNAEWTKLGHNYTQYDFAKMIGATRTTCNKIIAGLCDKEIIRIVNGKMEINRNNLEEIIYDY